MLTFQYILTAASVVVALAALLRARRVARRLEQLAESYWELRYEYGQLRARLDEGSDRAGGAVERFPTSGREGSFVPLSSLKR